MSDQAVNINKKLKLGIEAARGGQKNIAQVHLRAVLNVDPDNVAALFWLAYVVPSPQESIDLLERVLELEPNNQRAQTGIRWARQRLGQQPTPVETGDMAQTPADTQPQPVESTAEPEAAPATADSKSELDTEDGEESLRQKLLNEGQQKDHAKKGALAHRARRTIDPITTLLIIVGALGIIAVGLGILAFVPQETLAAWLPISERVPLVKPAQDIVPLAVPTATDLPAAIANNLANDGDTVFVKVGSLLEPEAVELESRAPPDAEPVPTETAVPAPLLEPNLMPLNPVSLMGPHRPPAPTPDPSAGVNIPPATREPIDQIYAHLAHQPAYPGEKWIEVNVTTQQVTAWEGDVPIFLFTVSTGLPNTPTVLGEYNIYWKLTSTTMSGPGYYLTDVPYTMYFYGGYSLHGTYWHNNFGQPMSHGCVNLVTEEAQKLFEWAGPTLPPGQTQITATADNPGTLVVVHQ